MNNCQSPYLGGRKMSSSLKERLRRLSRSHSSPLNPCNLSIKSQPPGKRHCLKNSPVQDLDSCEIAKSSDHRKPETLNEAVTKKSLCETIEHDDTYEKSEFDSDCYEDLDKDALLKYLHNMKMILSRKEETLHRLQMVKTYRSKNDLNRLSSLIVKWRSVSQESLKDLHCAIPEPRPSLTELIDDLQIDHELIKYNSEDNDFL